ncbi:diamine oxidase [copper-containing]-like [Montipora foliosa]|uniref:diamine oxidase [copper-containing]-like n=1 Tax=Montipora foliosa TaxID=591990 RepID=UPI0035F187DC
MTSGYVDASDPMMKSHSRRKSIRVCLTWKLLAIVFIVISIVLLIALIVVATKANKTDDAHGGKSQVEPNGGDNLKTCAEGLFSPDDSPKSVGVFDDLTVNELNAVRKYLLNQTQLRLTIFEKAAVNSNFIYSVQLLPPPKDEALAYLDGNGDKPERKAVAVVFRGADDPPVVKEYIVSPVEDPKKHTARKIPGGQRDFAPFNARPYDTYIENGALRDNIVLNASRKLSKLMRESYDGYSYDPDCSQTSKCLFFIATAPMGFSSEERYTPINFFRQMTGHYQHPVDLTFIVDHGGADVSKWKILSVIYNNQTFVTVEDLMDKYNNDSIKKIKIAAPTKKPLFSSYERRGDPQPTKPMRGPELYEPQGKRYTVKGRHINYMSWSFDFRMDSNSGMQIYDIKFNKERIIYELSLQEAAATYGGYYPNPSWNNFLDSNWRMGLSSYEMARGVDCPNTATFFDLVHMIGTPEPLTIHNAVCVFELNTGMPLRRHYDNNFLGGYNFYGGMANQVLVLRTVAVVYNYDYVFDFIFYQNGVVEVKVSASGYIFGSFYDSNSYPYGYKLNEHLTSGIHDHLLSYKVDLDVAGRSNSYETIEIGIENITERWFPNKTRVQKVLKRSVKNTELEAAYKFNFDTPKYLNFFNDAKQNSMGVRKGYRIQLEGILKQLYPEDWIITPIMSWSLYQMAVTKYKEDESHSTSIYNQNGPSNPVLDFRKYLLDNDSIVNEDLVAWVTIGMMHVPHSEDIPNIATAAESASFFIRPFNYFEEDPSMGSTNAILITRTDNPIIRQKVERYGTPDGPQCLPKEHKLGFKGTYG